MEIRRFKATSCSNFFLSSLNNNSWHFVIEWLTNARLVLQYGFNSMGTVLLLLDKHGSAYSNLGRGTVKVMMILQSVLSFNLCKRLGCEYKHHCAARERPDVVEWCVEGMGVFVTQR